MNAPDNVPTTREEAIARLRADGQASYAAADAFVASLPDDQRARMGRMVTVEPPEEGLHVGCGCR